MLPTPENQLRFGIRRSTEWSEFIGTHDLRQPENIRILANMAEEFAALNADSPYTSAIRQRSEELRKIANAQSVLHSKSTEWDDETEEMHHLHAQVDPIQRDLLYFINQAIEHVPVPQATEPDEIKNSEKRGPGQPKKARFEEAKGIDKYDHISWDDKSANIRKNSFMSTLSRIMLSKDVKVGDKREWSVLYKEVFREHPYSLEAWRRLDRCVRRIEAMTIAAGIGIVFSFEGGRDGFLKRLM